MNTWDKIKQIIDNQDAEIQRLKIAVKAGSKEPVTIEYENPVRIDGLWDIGVPLNANYAFSTDDYWYGIDKEDVQKVLDQHQNIKDMEYKESLTDCDDYAQALHGVFNQHGLSRFAFGYASSGGHAFNFFVDRNKKIWIVEPQTFEILDYEIWKYSNYKINKWII